MKNLWNDRYSKKDYVYGKTPNSFFRNFIDNESGKGNLLLPAEGEGRNAIYAALKGWKVYALDYSQSAEKKARELAKENNIDIEYRVVDLATWNEKIKVDVVASVFAHFDPESRVTIHKKFIHALKPGGKIVLEAFSKKQLHFDSGGPKDYDWLYSTKMLTTDFKSLNILSVQERTTVLDEGELHQGEASIIRMIAQKTE